MAKMWPTQVPDWVRNDKRRSAEIRVFESLERELDATWTVYYSRPWYGISSTGGEIEGEADFILVHPELGICFLEVKGGQISYDPKKSQWYSTDRNAIQHRIKDPVEQAKKCRYEFARKMQRFHEWPSHFVNFKYGALFPDTVEPELGVETIGGHDKALFCHASQFVNDLEQWILERISHHGHMGDVVGPGQVGLKIIDSLIAQPVILKSTLGSNIRNEIELMDRLLTGAQLQVILSLKSKRRAVVFGGAGTGKTLIATELARTFSREGLRVLLLTYSEPLELHLKKVLESEDSIEVRNILHVSYLREMQKLWDLVIVDEGQDVEWSLWHEIEKLTKDLGKLFVFMDSNQSIYRLPADLSTQLNADEFELNLNLRNTKMIAKATEPLYQGPLIHAPGPVGELPKIISAGQSGSALNECVRLLNELKLGQSVPLGDITVLTRDKNSRDKIQHELAKQGFLSCNAGERNYGLLCVETVPRFKGLESPIVIAMCDSEWANNSEMSYVAISRARSRFYLIGNTSGSLFNQAISTTSTV